MLPHSASDPQPIFDQLRSITSGAVPAAKAAPLELDFDGDPEAPDYIVDRLFERQTVNVLSGDTGAGKSLVVASLVVAICTDHGEWLGREVYGARVLVVDEENPKRVVNARLRALGLRNEHRERLRYFNRQGFRVGELVWTALLHAEAADHGADLVVIDTAAAATSADVNDNDDVTRLYTEALRPIATKLNIAVVILHHERKQQQGQTRDRGQAMMGARQWAGQADAHVSLRVDTDLIEEPAEGGLRTLRRSFVMETPKVRDGEPNIAALVVVTSEKDASNRLLSMSVTDGGRYERTPSKQDVLAERIGSALLERGEMKRAEIAAALEVVDDGTFQRSLERAETNNTIQKIRRGVYRAAPAEPVI